jgi:hypothetical protein
MTATAEKLFCSDNMPIIVALFCKAYVCSRLITGIVVSNPAEDMDVHLLSLMCAAAVAPSAIGWSIFQSRTVGWLFVMVCVCFCVCVI